MTIDRLNSLDPIREPKKPSGAGMNQRAGKGDSIAISSDAVAKAELFNVLEVAKAAPDVRTDRVAEVKLRLQDPAYINDSVLSMTADRIVDQLLGNS
ncbi:MAG: flagellar biosynthesis anti-sigma factor FlgM [Treponema sp.]|nr:flagellar biosynthesis anti-sigma factor FlgM [Treponema sp.]